MAGVPCGGTSPGLCLCAVFGSMTAARQTLETFAPFLQTKRHFFLGHSGAAFVALLMLCTFGWQCLFVCLSSCFCCFCIRAGFGSVVLESLCFCIRAVFFQSNTHSFVFSLAFLMAGFHASLPQQSRMTEAGRNQSINQSIISVSTLLYNLQKYTSLLANVA